MRYDEGRGGGEQGGGEERGRGGQVDGVIG